MLFYLCLVVTLTLTAAAPASQDAVSDEQRWLEILKMMEDEYREAEAEPQPTEYGDYTDEFQGPGPLAAVPNWPQKSVTEQLGQVSGVAVDPEGNVFVLHRGNRQWSDDTFDRTTNKYLHEEDGPIKEATIVKIDPKKGKQLEAWGENLFFMPHGLNIDGEGNLWVTDVAMHQVFKFNKGSKKPDLTLGTRFQPGDSNTTFCKPTDVAVTRSGDFFVADGYCNHRIIKYSKDGTVLKQWGESPKNEDITPGPYELAVPHSLALVEEVDVICVADREHGRIQCYNAGIEHANTTGVYNTTFTDERFGAIYAITFSVEDALFYIVNGDTDDVRGFTINPEGGDVLEIWSPPAGFGRPHDVAVSPDGLSVYVGEIGPNRVWQFYRDINQ